MIYCVVRMFLTERLLEGLLTPIDDVKNDVEDGVW